MERPLDAFCRSNQCLHGRSWECRNCRIIRGRAYRQRMKAEEPNMPANKKCGRCKHVLPAENFGRRADSRTGLSHYCRGCEREVKRQSALRHPETVKRSQLFDRIKPERRAKRKERLQQRAAEGFRQSRLAPIDPKKLAARHAVKAAVKAGLMVRPDKCSRCGDAPAKARGGRSLIQAHHHMGYDNPLDVIWLCIDCHMTEHHPIDLSLLEAKP